MIVTEPLRNATRDHTPHGIMAAQGGSSTNRVCFDVRVCVCVRHFYGAQAAHETPTQHLEVRVITLRYDRSAYHP